MPPVLAVDSLRTQFFSDDRAITAVDSVSFSVRRGETLGIVGESGCGKSATSLSIMRLLPEHSGRVTGGRIMLGETDLLTLSEEEMRAVRGNRISMIFQEPMTSLNPVYSIGDQIEEAIYSHEDVSRKEARDRSIELLRIVGIPDPERRHAAYPFQMSGGMRQRVMIAIAMACNPDVLIADEPTTALDVTIQAQILELMQRTQEEFGTAILFITHDLGVIAEVADRVAVMYAGQIVETGGVEEIFYAPKHPYTQGLLKSIPSVDRSEESLEAIAGAVPSPARLPEGCRFRPRCPHARGVCRAEEPILIAVEEGHAARCLQYTPLWRTDRE
ncbi:MAG: ABC transporter ATP-binding protein [Spirochaetales bacterium]|nr:ABC transporter ATP-binding protein [Spirochaetales bacterium]